jgi:hypothetical protein
MTPKICLIRHQYSTKRNFISEKHNLEGLFTYGVKPLDTPLFDPSHRP